MVVRGDSRSEGCGFESQRRILDTHFLKKEQGATIAQWIRLLLPSCRPGFESLVHHQSFYQFIFDLCYVEKTKIRKVISNLDVL